MATSPLNDPITHLTNMVGQLVRQNQTLIGHIDRVAGSLSEIAQDMRVQQIGTGKAIAGLRTEIHARFDSTGTRFDEFDERWLRLERNIDALRSDILRLENGVLNAQQSALQAHQRLGEAGDSNP
jgi:hypothetical protein